MIGLLTEDELDAEYLRTLGRNQNMGVNPNGPLLPGGGGETYGNPMSLGALGSNVMSGVNALAEGFDPVRLGRGVESAVQGVNYPEGAVAYGPFGVDGAPAFRMRDGSIREATAADQRHGGLLDLMDIAPMAGVGGGPRGTLGAGARRMARGADAAADAPPIQRTTADTTVTRAGAATPDEITEATRRIDAEGTTQAGLRQEYERLGLTGYEPHPEVRQSLLPPPQAEIDRALAAKLVDRDYLASLPPDQRRAVMGTTKEDARIRRENDLALPSQRLSPEQVAENRDLQRSIVRATRDVERTRAQRNNPAAGLLFDLSPERLNRLPDAPQFDLPRVQPRETERLAGTASAGPRRLREAAENANPEDAGWYNLEQIRDQFVQHHGRERGERLYGTFLDYVAGTSMVNPIENNLRTASHYLGRTMRGEPLPMPLSMVDPNTGKAVQTLAAPPPNPYGAKSQIHHAQRAREFVTGQIDPVANPKPLSYRQNLGGNWQPITVDTHEIRNFVGMPRALGTFGENAALLPGEYSLIEDAGQRVAERMGLRPAQRQAATWTGGGAYTKLKSAPVPAMRAFEDRVLITARVRGISPEEALTQFVRDGVPLLSTGPNPAALSARGLLDRNDE
jgi:hypothetical protein